MTYVKVESHSGVKLGRGASVSGGDVETTGSEYNAQSNPKDN